MLFLLNFHAGQHRMADLLKGNTFLIKEFRANI
jgi:hypothetical protein